MKLQEWIAGQNLAWKLFLSMLVVSTFLFTGKAMSSKDNDRKITQEQMRVYDALEIAVHALEKNKLMYREEYKLTASRVDNEWVFWFVFLPETFGEDVTVFVSDDGQTRFLPGF